MPRKGEKRPPNVGRKKGTPNKDKLQFKERLAALGCDPIELTALYAMGDVVRLKLMTREEFDAPAREEPSIKDGLPCTKYIPSGRQVALAIVPPKTRADSAMELLQYIAPKLKAIEHTGKIDAVQYVAMIPCEAPSVEAWAAKAGTTPKE